MAINPSFSMYLQNFPNNLFYIRKSICLLWDSGNSFWISIAERDSIVWSCLVTFLRVPKERAFWNSPHKAKIIPPLSWNILQVDNRNNRAGTGTIRCRSVQLSFTWFLKVNRTVVFNYVLKKTKTRDVQFHGKHVQIAWQTIVAD